MDFTRLRALGSLFSMLNQSVRNVLNYNQNHQDFPMQVGNVSYSQCVIFTGNLLPVVFTGAFFLFHIALDADRA